MGCFLSFAVGQSPDGRRKGCSCGPGCTGLGRFRGERAVRSPHQAASALAGRSRSDLGSAELNLLAGNPAAISPAAADKFYFYEARIKAAQNAADSQTKLQLLSHCANDFPRRDEARVPLFQAAASLRSDEFALGVLEPLLHAQFLGSTASSSAYSEEEQIVGSDNDEENESGGTNTPVTPSARLSRTQRAQVAQMIGETMARLNRLSEAVSYFEIARRSQSSPAVRKDLTRRIADLKAALRIEHQNAARQPLLHEALEQDRIVRPRLLAKAGPAPKAATTKAGKP